jgi:hypothetical protein
MRRPKLSYAHQQAAAFIGACLILGGALGVLWVRFKT